MALSLLALLAGCAGTGGLSGNPADQGGEAITENDNDKIAFDYFLGQGLTPVQCAGIVGNLDQESGMDPTIWQYGDGPGRGIAQWSAGERWDTTPNANVVWYAGVMGDSKYSLNLQLAFIWWELTNEGYGFDDLQAATTVEDAVEVFQDQYEICGACDSSNRVAHAYAALQAFGGDQAAPPAAPPAIAGEGSQAFLYPGQQHFVNRDGAGDVRHHWWDAGADAVTTDTWGSGAAGNPVSFVDGTSQHVFARGNDGSLLHWFWDPQSGNGQDVWAPGGALAGDPAAMMIGDFQDVWAVDGGGSLQHWFWGPHSNGVQHDTWGAGVVGRPSVLVTKSGEQHAFARGTGGTLEHWWWTPGGGISHDTWGQGLAGDPAALAIGDFQDVWAVDGAGLLQHWYWGPSTNGVQHDTWGSGVVGRPSVALYGNGDQEAFVRGTGGTVEHFWWDAALGISHDTWGDGIAEDPTAEIVDDQQHVWAADGAGHVQHWFWAPDSGMHHDDWGK
ncbi:MAG TPA: phage tail tip lysozyme [Minicystis sp.]|nr:phage tail tip lysozyme [Minicystis sp.]